MIKGNSILDKRDNTLHVVECVDVYDEVTLVFTEGKKYIPIDKTTNITDVVDREASTIAEELKRFRLETRRIFKEKYGIDLTK